METSEEENCGALHGGILILNPRLTENEVLSLARQFSIAECVACIWVRGISEDTWGFELLARCNGKCREFGIDHEIKDLASKVNKLAKADVVSGYDFGGKVLFAEISNIQ